MSLIDISSFTGVINIAGKDKPSVAPQLQMMIETYEPEFLNKLLGDDFYQLYLDNQNEQRFTDLIDYLVPENNRSVIAFYVFYMYQYEFLASATGGGDVTSISENANNVSSSYRMRQAWNFMVDMNRKFYKWIEVNKDTYPEFTFCGIDKNLIYKINDFGL